MALHRTHVLLEPEQHQALVEIARREGRSVSDVTRELVQHGIVQRQDHYNTKRKRRLQALENARRIRKAILEERGGKPVDVDFVALLHEMREERDASLLNRRG